MVFWECITVSIGCEEAQKCTDRSESDLKKKKEKINWHISVGTTVASKGHICKTQLGLADVNLDLGTRLRQPFCRRLIHTNHAYHLN